MRAYASLCSARNFPWGGSFSPFTMALMMWIDSFTSPFMGMMERPPSM